MAEEKLRVAIAPRFDEWIAKSVAAGGGEPVDASEPAEALVWLDPRDPDGLRETVQRLGPDWVQLPFAGIEDFFEAGAIDDGRFWTCMKGAYGHACAEHSLALMLAATRHLYEHVRATTWRGGTFGQPERRLNGSTVLILGTGGIARELVPMLRPLGARVTAVGRSGNPLPGAVRTGTSDDLLEFAADADFLVVAAALTAETRRIVSKGVLEALPESAWVINVARGGLVDTDALVEALASGSIAGAGLDVTDPEPLPDGHPLWALDNVIITPHVANTWDMALPELFALVERNVSNYVGGRALEGIVDVKAGY